MTIKHHSLWGIILALLFASCSESSTTLVGPVCQKTVVLARINLMYSNGQAVVDKSGVKIEIEDKIAYTEADGAAFINDISIMKYHPMIFSYEEKTLFERNVAFAFSDTMPINQILYLQPTSTANLILYQDTVLHAYDNIALKGSIDIATNDCYYDVDKQQYIVYALLFLGEEDAELDYKNQGNVYKIRFETDSFGNVLSLSRASRIDNAKVLYSDFVGKTVSVAIIGHFRDYSFYNQIATGYKDQSYYTVLNKETGAVTYKNIGSIANVNIE